MISDRPYLQNWRPIYELSSSAVWFSAMITAYTLSFFSSLPLIGFVLTSASCGVMMFIRLRQALPRWQQHRRLKGKKLALLKLTEKKCHSLQTKNQEQGVWLGWGFEWQRHHGQRAWDLLRSDNLPTKSEKNMGAGWIHGMEEHEEPLYQPLEQTQMHTMVIGVPGSGKTRLFDLLVTQAVLRNEPVIIVDPKGDHDLASHTLRSCELSGNQYRFMKFHPGFPANSIRINLLQNFNRSSELASRISGLMPSGGDNAPFQAFAQLEETGDLFPLQLLGELPNLEYVARLGGGRLLKGRIPILCSPKS
ncbi:helicase HerA domain-containing protein [Endozoicomonas sp. ALB032]|uniref:helicase HerA domain-containing protein n=1 Tax=Endozoicomonas sp. ALB032 TaxID=3403082 RepID=UPI003BB4D448